MKNFLQIKVGDTIKPKIPINDIKVRNWKYGKECSTVGGGMLPHAELKIVEISRQPNNQWLRAEIGGSHGTRHLKLTPEEFMQNFVAI